MPSLTAGHPRIVLFEFHGVVTTPFGFKGAPYQISDIAVRVTNITQFKFILINSDRQIPFRIDYFQHELDRSKPNALHKILESAGRLP